MRFTKSDRERGYVANSVWTVTARFRQTASRCQTGNRPAWCVPAGQADNILTGVCHHAHSAQGASETFAITLEGTEGGWKQMAGFEFAYVALSRMKHTCSVHRRPSGLLG